MKGIQAPPRVVRERALRLACELLAKSNEGEILASHIYRRLHLGPNHSHHRQLSFEVVCINLDIHHWDGLRLRL